MNENDQLNSMGKRLIRLMDDHLRNKGDMPFELRHYQGLVLKARIQTPVQWLLANDDKAVLMWNYYTPEQTLEDPDDPFGFLRKD